MRNSLITFAMVTSLVACKFSHKVAGTDMDRQAADIKKNIPDFDLARLGEGIKLALNADVLFELDKFDLRDRMRKDMDALAASLQRYPETKIEIRGYTDNAGNDSHNMVLSGNRARAVEKYLEDKGIAPKRISAKGYGSNDPKYPNDNNANRALNRRVEFYIYQ
jgi:outer membrane protein OmpA-like peptidoglycan-associated protein